MEGIIMESDREIRLGENRVYLGEDDIIHVIPVGNMNGKTAVIVIDEGLKLADMVEGKVNVLIDLNKAGKPSPEARKAVLELYDHEKSGKMAFFGQNPVSRVVASFVIGITRKNDVRFFKTKEEALGWLKD
jgi:hypothetical protein